ncbi:MAG: hypothetical protein V1818_01915 [Candidatus Aenigmatarchaeota archaeon]
MDKSETFQKYRSEGLRAVLDLCLEMAREKGIKDESVAYETFRETAKKFIPDATEKDVARTIEEYEKMKKG